MPISLKKNISAETVIKARGKSDEGNKKVMLAKSVINFKNRDFKY